MGNLFRVAFIIAFLMGCAGNETLDDFGKNSTGECRRSEISDLAVEVSEGSGFQNDIVALEQDDLVFPWEEVIKSITEFRQKYIQKLKKLPENKSSYFNCQMSNKDWQSYWSSVTKAAWQVTEFKNTIALRVGYRLGQRRMDNEQKKAAIDLLKYLEEDLDVYGERILDIQSRLQSSKYLSSAERTSDLAASLETFKRTLSNTIRNFEGSAEVNGSSLLAQIRNASEELGSP